jgi:hypothetical protein
MFVKAEVLRPLTISIEISTFDVPTSSSCTLRVPIPILFQNTISLT